MLVSEKSSDGKWLKTAFEKTPTYRYFAQKSSWRKMCFQVRAILSRHLIHTVLRLTQAFVDRWWLNEVWCALDILSNSSTHVPFAGPGITRSLRKRICRGTFSQKTRNWPTCNGKPVRDRSRESREPKELQSSLLCRQLDSGWVLSRQQDVLMLTFMVTWH